MCRHFRFNLEFAALLVSLKIILKNFDGLNAAGRIDPQMEQSSSAP